MPLSPGQIKDKLTNALDDEKNVINEEAIEEVIALLEASTLSKEILEQTRLGRDINLVRKNCKNPAIAKRAKNLVKSWQKLLVQPGSPQVANGQHPSCVPSQASPALHVSPGLTAGRAKPLGRGQPSPALSQTKQQQLKTGSPGVQTGVKLGQQIPAAKAGQSSKGKGRGSAAKSPRPVTRSSSNSNVVNEDSNLSWPGTPPVASESSQDRLAAAADSSKPDSTPGGAGKQPPSASSQKRHFNFDSKSADHSTVSTRKSNRASDQRDVSKTNVANRKRTRKSAALEDCSHSPPDIPSSKQPRLSTSSPCLSASAYSKNDVINGSLIKKPITQISPALAASTSAADTQEGTEDASNRSCSKVDLPRQDSVSSRLSMHSIDSRSSRSKTNRVKTTEQLIEDMQLRSATSVGNEVIAQIRTQQLQKETDQQKAKLPASGKRRGRKKKKGAAEPLELPDSEAVSEGRKLAQAKSEYIKRFLQTSVAPTPGEDNYESTTISHSRQEFLEEQPIALGECSSSFSQSAFESYPSRQDKPDSGPSASPPDVHEILESGAHGLTPGSLGDASSLSRLTEGQILALLPPLDVSNIDWTSHDYPSPQRAQVGEGTVDRLHSENMEGVNGTYDRDGQFRRWADMLTLDSVYDEPLYILPYVIPND